MSAKSAKSVVYIRGAEIVPAALYWPGRVDGLVLTGYTVSRHPVLGAPIEGVPVRTSLIVRQDLAARRIETVNTIYEVVA